MNRPIPFGKYYLLERINVGGMAEVFRAKAYGVEGFERLLAVKRILPTIAEDEEFIEMFIDEAKIAVQLNHANIAQIFDLGKVEDAYFIALEYVHGKDLRAIFDRCRASSELMPLPQACFIVMKICEGLDYAHNKRDGSGREMHLVHRDVSPQNVLVSYEGEVKLVDFGIAKAAGKASKTQAGILKGKFGYMSPEQVRGLPLDRRSDIFSVGIILYELLTGERLFLGESDFATLEKVRNVEILPPSTFNRNVSEELEQIVMRALAKDVEDRYQNAIDLHDDLQAHMYTTGEFYSRKDLAGWQKRMFAKEIEEEGRKLEAYRQMPLPELTRTPPPPPPGSNGRPSGGLRVEATADVPTPPKPPPRRTSPLPAVDSALEIVEDADAPTPAGGPALTWDEDEVETQIYDKPGGSSPALQEMVPEVLGREVVPSVTGPLEPPKDVERPAPSAAAGPSVGSRPSMPSMPSIVPPVEHEIADVVPAMPSQPRSAARHKRGGSRLALYAVLIVLFMGAGGAAAYYFLVWAKRPGALLVKSKPPDVAVLVDGKRQPGESTPLTIDKLAPGSHVVTARRAGFQNWETTVRVPAGGKVELEAKMVALPSVELRTRPAGATAWLDGKQLPRQTPMRITHVKPGHHKLEVRKPPKYQRLIHEFDIAPATTERLALTLLPREVEVSINSVPKGDAYLVRGGQEESLGRTPATVKVDPKHAYKVAIKRDGYETFTQSLSFDGAKPVKVEAKLSKAAEPDRRPAKSPRASADGKQRPREKPDHKPAGRRPAGRSPAGRQPTARRDPSHGRQQPERGSSKPQHPERPASTATGKLLINSNPWTKIIVDGRDTGLTTPQRGIELSAGRHKIRLRNPKFQIDKSFSIRIKPDGKTKVIKNFKH